MKAVRSVAWVVLVCLTATAEESASDGQLGTMDVEEVLEAHLLHDLPATLEKPDAPGSRSKLPLQWKAGDRWAVEVFWGGPHSGKKPEEMVSWSSVPPPYWFEVKAVEGEGRTYRVELTDSKGNLLQTFEVDGRKFGYQRGRVLSLELPRKSQRGFKRESPAGISPAAVHLLETLPPRVAFPVSGGNVIDALFHARITPGDDRAAKGEIHQRWDPGVPVYPLTSVTRFPGGWVRLTLLREVHLR